MKLTDWCILCSALFLCMMLPLDIRSHYVAQAFCRQEQYERILDRTCEDSLLDSVLLENDDGTVQADVAGIRDRFDELLTAQFDSISAEQKEYLCSCIRMKQFEYLDDALPAGETDRIRQQFEQIVAENSTGKGEKDENKIAFYFPYIAGEEWYQNIAGPSLYSFFEADSRKDPWERYRRYVFSGGRIVKQDPEAESEAGLCGSYSQP